MAQVLGRIARATLGGACLVWAGMSAAVADEAVPSGGVRRVAGGAEPALNAYERKLEGIRRGWPRSTGSKAATPRATVR
jgi:hypothetical protein